MMSARVTNMAPPSNPLSEPKPSPAEPRPVADFGPSPWGDQFLHYTLDIKMIEAQEELAKELKEELKRELLLSVGEKPLMEQLRVVDSIERLGVAYHFETEIEDILRRINIHELSSFDDLVFTSLCFRLLRQHGFKLSSDVFKRFMGPNGSFKEEVEEDVHGMLSLYEACHVRGHDEDILEEALGFTKSNLTKIVSDQLTNPSLEERIRHALQKPLNKRLTRVECVRYMKIYEEDEDPQYSKTLLKFAKVDFNLLQAFHKKELSEIYRWWKGIDVTSALPLRDRIVESYFWGSAVYFEPQYTVARKIAIMGCQILTSVDDVYDAYATLEELEIFTEAVRRWDRSCLEQLPKDLRWFYQTLLLEAHEEMERDLAPKGRSQYVRYAVEEMKALCETYLIEAKWRHNKYIPTLDEYMAIAHRNIAYVAAVDYTFLGMDTASNAEFEWVSNLSKPVKAVSLLLRILDDIGGNKFDEIRGHPCLIVECYMKEYGVSFEGAYKLLYKKIDELWKDMNESVMQPSEVPMPLLKCVLNLGRAVETIYDAGEDGFTSLNRAMKQNIHNLYIHPVPT